MSANDDLSAPRYRAFREGGPLRSSVPGLSSYRGFAEVLEVVETAGRGGARVSIAGESHEGAPIVRVDLGPADAPRTSLVIGGIHAMEWIGVESCLALLERLTAISLERRVVIFPVLNPDGFRSAERDLRTGRKRFVRANARGVDLNRNWPTHWEPWLALPALFPFLGRSGEAPGSEPEIRAVLGAIDRTSRWDRGLSFHSFGKVLLLPYGGRWAAPERMEALRANALAVKTGLPDYRIRQASHWMPGSFVYGMELDHFAALGMDGLLVECAAGGLRLGSPSSWVHPLRWYNPPALEDERSRIANGVLPFVLGY